MQETQKPPLEAVGKPVQRQDGRLKVTGRATYAAEYAVPNLAYGFIVESTIACGRITRIDDSAAKAAGGVIAVVTHLNAPRLFPIPREVMGVRLTGEGGVSEEQQPLQDAEVVFAGQPVALVVAETYEQARHSATLVKIDYEKSAPVLTLEAGLPRATRPEIFGGNIEQKMQVKRGQAGTVLDASPLRIEQTYTTPIEHHNPIEPTAIIAWWDGDKLTVYESCRFIEGAQKVQAESWGLPLENVRVQSHFIGGSFGSKGFQFRNGLITALAARVAGRPVKLALTRQQMFTLAGHRPRTVQRLAFGAKADGTLQAIRHEIDTHTSQVSGFLEPVGRVTQTVYGSPNLELVHQVAPLNLPSPCPMRAPGEAPGMWSQETLMDEMAHQLKVDPIELRLRSCAERDPETQKPWSSNHLRECYREGAKRFGWDRRKPVPRSTRAGRYLIGHGMASAFYPAGQRSAGAVATIFADGRAVVRSATHDQGNGAYTAFRQIAADALGMELEKVIFELGDSNFPSAPAAGGSVTTATVGEAIVRAGTEVRRKMLQLAAGDSRSPLAGREPEAMAVKNGRVFLKEQPGIGDDFGTLLRRAGKQSMITESASEPGPSRREFSFYSFGAVFAEVRVDEELGVLRVTRISGVYDMGRIINPRMAQNQLHGGIMLALGSALMEETLYDPRTGRAVIRNLADYHIPTIADTPEIDIAFLDIPDPHMGTLGARGLGEIGVVGTIAAIGNALFNATGKRLRDLPLTPDKLIG